MLYMQQNTLGNKYYHKSKQQKKAGRYTFLKYYNYKILKFNPKNNIYKIKIVFLNNP